MGVFEKDFIVRIIQQLAKVLAAALKLRQSGKNEEALDELHRASGDLLGIDWDVLALSDPAGAASVLGTSDRIRTYARLVEEESITLRAAGKVFEADRARDRASALHLEVLRLREDAESRAALDRLRS